MKQTKAGFTVPAIRARKHSLISIKPSFQKTMHGLLRLTMAALVSQCMAFEACADNGAIEVEGWEKTANAFGEDTGSELAISGSALLDARIAEKANVSLSCNHQNGRVILNIGITNGNFDIATTQNVHRTSNYSGDPFGNALPDSVYTTQTKSLKLQEKLSPLYSKEVAYVQTSIPNKFSHEIYPTNDLARADAYLVGIPVNGTEPVLHIPLKQPVIHDFLQSCLAVGKQVQQVEEVQKKAAVAAAWQKQVDHANRKKQIIASIKAFCFRSRQDVTAKLALLKACTAKCNGGNDAQAFQRQLVCAQQASNNCPGVEVYDQRLNQGLPKFPEVKNFMCDGYGGIMNVNWEWGWEQ